MDEIKTQEGQEQSKDKKDKAQFVHPLALESREMQSKNYYPFEQTRKRYNEAKKKDVSQEDWIGMLKDPQDREDIYNDMYKDKNVTLTGIDNSTMVIDSKDKFDTRVKGALSNYYDLREEEMDRVSQMAHQKAKEYKASTIWTTPLGVTGSVGARILDPEYRADKALERKARDLAKAAEERKIAIRQERAEDKGEESGFWNGAKNVLRGAIDAGLDADTWDFGFSDVNNSYYNFAEKGDDDKRGREYDELHNALTEIERYEGANDTNNGYEVGRGIIETIPYMITAPIGLAAAGWAAARGLGKRILAKGGSTLVGELAKGTGRAAVGGGVAAVTVDALHTASSYMDKRAEGQGVIEAGAKAITGQTLERGSEMLGDNVFKPVRSAMAKRLLADNQILSKPLKALNGSTIGKTLENINKSKFAKKVKGVEKYTQFDGFGEEMAEEYVNMGLNALLVGDNQFEDLTDKDTFYAIAGQTALMSGVFAGGRLAGYQSPVKQARRARTKVRDIEVDGKLTQFYDDIDKITDVGERHKALVAFCKDETKERTQAAFDYVALANYSSGVEEGSAQDPFVVNKQMAEIQSKYELGREQDLGAAYRDFQANTQEYSDKEKKQLDAVEDISTFLIGIKDPKEHQRAKKYFNQRAIYRGASDNIAEREQGERERYINTVLPMVNATRGSITTVKIVGDTEGVYNIIEGDLDQRVGREAEKSENGTIIVASPKGQRKMIARDEIVEVVSDMPVSDFIAPKLMRISEKYQAMRDKAHKPLPKNGDNVMVDGNSGFVQNVNADGDYIVELNTPITNEQGQSQNIVNVPRNEVGRLDRIETTTEEPNENKEQKPLPLAKDGDIDYDAIEDAETFGRALKDDFDSIDEVIEVLENYRANLEKSKKATSRITDAARQKKARKAIDKRMAMFDEVKQRVLGNSTPVTEPQQNNASETDIETTTEEPNENKEQKPLPLAKNGDIDYDAIEDAETFERASAEIKQNWQDAMKEYGNEDTFTLPNGEVLHGRWVVVEAGSVTPSHDPVTLQPTKGFPLSSTGTTVNDNDYQNGFDRVQSIAQDYDARAIDNPVVVNHGIVVSGNRRTIGSQRSAKAGTDTKYREALDIKAPQKGIENERLEGFENPRVVFELSEDIPMTTETFAKFNAPSVAQKSSTQRAINAGKTVQQEEINAIVGLIDDHSDITGFYKSVNSQKQVRDRLMQIGYINENELPTIFDESGFTGNGRDMLESLVIGTAVGENQVKQLNTPKMKQYRAKIIKGIGNINRAVQYDRSITDDINNAIDYLYQAHNQDRGNIGEMVQALDIYDSTFEVEGIILAIAMQKNFADFKEFSLTLQQQLENVNRDNLFGEQDKKQDIYDYATRENFNETEQRIINQVRERNSTVSSQEQDITRTDNRGYDTRDSRDDDSATNKQISEINDDDKPNAQYHIENKKTSPKTVTGSVGKPQPTIATAILSDAGAKVIQNIDNAIGEYKKRPNSSKGFITDISQALELKQKGSSHYGHFILPNGNEITIRISNHNARVGNFDDNSENDAISIVISGLRNKGVNNDGKAHVKEFFHSKIGLSKHKGKPLADIATSIKELLQTGDYIDHTGIAQVEDVNKVENSATELAVEALKKAGVEVKVVDDNYHDSEIKREVGEKLSILKKAETFIHNNLIKGIRGKSFTIDLPRIVRARIQNVMGRDFDSHNISINGIVHSLKEHGKEGKKITKNSIPITKENTELIPYIITAPDKIVKGSTENNRDSIRFYKNLSNGYVVVVEKEQKNSPYDMDTITMWTELSNAPDENTPSHNAQDATISTSDIAKIKKDAEIAIEKDVIVQYHSVYHGSPYNFSQFDHAFMGSGEGNQAFGWGTYVTEVKEIGKSYAVVRYSGEKIESPYFDKFVAQISSAINSNGKGSKEIINEQIKALEDKIKDERELILSNTNDLNVNEDSIIDEQIEEWQDQITLLKQLDPDKFNRNLYSVEIPNNNGNNYLDWSNNVDETTIDKLINLAESEGFDTDYFAEKIEEYSMQYNVTGEALYKMIDKYLFDNNSKQTSQLLEKAGYTGIVYPAESTKGGRADNAKNYVIFNENSLEITDHVQYLKTPQGVVYGWTVGGKIYLTENSLNPNTPIHEYTHIWDTACMESNPELWEKGVELMKQTPLWNEVVNNPYYKDIARDDNLVASEVHARLSGAKGEEYFINLAKQLEGVTSPLTISEHMGNVANLKKWVNDFWNWLKSLITPGVDISNLTLDEFANMPVSDLIKKANSSKSNGNPQNDGIRFRDGDNDAKNEIEAIKANAIKDGTFMKAPNGKPTNLNERQWLQVRTKAFKEWFGDWLKSARIEKLRNSKAILFNWKNSYTLNRTEAKQWLKDNIRGSFINKDTGDKIEISKVGIDKITSHGEREISHLKSFYLIPQFIEQSIFIEERPNRKNNGKYDSYKYYVVGANIDGVDYTIKIVIGIKGDKKFYDHELTEIEKGALINNLNLLPKQVADNKTPLSESKDTTLNSILQTNSSKVVDENGEPLVVYHGSSSNNITEFDMSKSTREPSSLKEFGYFFTSNKEIAEMYADIPMRKELIEEINAEIDKLREQQAETRNNRDYYAIEDAIDMLEAQMNGRIYETFLNLRDMHEVDAEGKTFYDGRQKLYVPLSYKTATGIDAIEALAGKNSMDQSVKVDGIKMANVIEMSIGSNDPTLLERYFAKYGGDSYQVFDANNIKSATANNGEFSKHNNDIRYRGDINLDNPLAVNNEFNQRLQQQIDGTLEKGYVYSLGYPGEALLSSGVAYLPIELSAEVLSLKSSNEYKRNHPFSLESIKDLPKAIQEPIAIFESTKKDGSKVILTELSDGKNNFVVVMRVSKKGKGYSTIVINDIKSLYPKERFESILDWINSKNNLLKYINKEKALNYSLVQSTNLIGNGYNTQDFETKVNEKLESSKEKIEKFENPTSEHGRKEAELERIESEVGIKVRIGDNSKSSQSSRQRESKGWFDMTTGEVYFNNIVNVTLVGWLEVRVSEPLCSCIICLDTLNPIPLPPLRVVKNGVNRLSTTSGEI